MGRALIIIRDDEDRAKACAWVRKAPPGTRVEYKETKRSVPQSDKMWAMLGEVAEQTTHFDMKFNSTVWKVLLMDMFGIEIRTVPSLDGKSLLPLEYSSSDLGKSEMSDFIEFIYAWGSEHGVVFRDEKPPQNTGE